MSDSNGNSNGNGKKMPPIVLRFAYGVVVSVVTFLATWVWHANTEAQRTSDRVEVVEKQCEKADRELGNHGRDIGEIKTKVGVLDTKADATEKTLNRIERKIDKAAERLPGE